jgi:phosphonate transport system substrate-binding protein
VTVLLVLIAAAVGWKAARMIQVEKPLEENKSENGKVQLSLTGSDVNGTTTTLASNFTDADGDMLADTPTDPAKLIDPPTLVFCYVADDEPEKVRDKWKPFCDHLSKVTGKPVEYLLVNSIEDQLKALQDGKLQVSGLNTGAVPYAVNTAGFIPVCRVPTNDPGGTHVEIIVPSSSSIAKPADLKGHELVFTDASSNSGYKAPIVLLNSEDSLEPERDYVIRMSGAHELSIEGIAKGEYQAAAVASDMLARAEAAGEIKKDQYHSIYKSENFPSAALGYVYNLKPELAAKVKEALLSYDLAGSPLEQDFVGIDQTKFVPVNYKNDWALIRRIDEDSARFRAGK